MFRTLPEPGETVALTNCRFEAGANQMESGSAPLLNSVSDRVTMSAVVTPPDALDAVLIPNPRNPAIRGAVVASVPVADAVEVTAHRRASQLRAMTLNSFI